MDVGNGGERESAGETRRGEKEKVAGWYGLSIFYL